MTTAEQWASMTANRLADTIEEGVLRCSRGAAPQISAVPELVQGGITTWAKAEKILQLLSFDPNGEASLEGCWSVLGLSALHGQAPTMEEVQVRLKIGTDIADLSSQPTWTTGEAAKAMHFKATLVKAAQLAVDALPAVLKLRRQTKVSSSVPRWLEPDPDFTTFIAADARKDQGNTVIAVNLSNLHGLDIAALSPIVLGPEHCRHIYRALYGSPAEITQCIKSFNGKNMVLWAPDNGRAMGQVMGVLEKMVKEGDCAFNLHFLVPFVPIPHCTNADMISELWSHQMLAPKYNHIRKEVAYYLQPMRCAFPGNTAPLHHLKSLVLITMRSSGPPQPPTLRNFKQDIVQHQIGRAVRVDVPEDQKRGVNIFLNQLQMMHCLGWEVGPKSPGSHPSAKRACIVGYFDAQQVSTLDMVGIVRHLRLLPELHHAFVGQESLFGNQHALILDHGDARCLYKAKDMISELIMVSPNRAIIDTQHTAAEWEAIMTSQHHQDPKSAIKSIRFRMGIFGGKVFAKPGVLPTYAYNERARQRLNNAPGEIRERELLSTRLHVAGLPQTQKNEIIDKIMIQVRDFAGIPLALRTGEVLAPGEWEAGEDAVDGGGVNLLLRSPDEHIKLLSCMHGAGLVVNGHHLCIEVCSIQRAQFAGAACRVFEAVPGSSAVPSSSIVSPSGGSSSS